MFVAWGSIYPMLDHVALHRLSRKCHDAFCTVEAARGRSGQMPNAPRFRAGCKIEESEASIFQSRGIHWTTA